MSNKLRFKHRLPNPKSQILNHPILPPFQNNSYLLVMKDKYWCAYRVERRHWEGRERIMSLLMGYGTCATSILLIVLLFPFPQAKLSIADLSVLSQKVIMQFFKGGTVSIVLKNHQNVLICFHHKHNTVCTFTN